MSEDEDLPRLLSGRYRLEGTLGRGGMGVVYRGTDLMMKRPIAVKLIRAVDGNELDDEIAGRFLREAKNTARLQHEHIIEVFDLGRSDEGMYFVMELLEGESLSARIRRDGAISALETVHIGRQIAEALQVAHVAGVIHRDLKPANVMLLSRAGDENFVKVLDFGVAKSAANAEETQLTHTGMLVGTVDYMAPEQIMGKPVDGRTDIYALGIVLYKMLSGKAPFRDTGVPALIHAHMNTMPKPLIEVAPGVPNELDHVVLRCLAKSPDRRYESMAELARALTAAIAPEGDDLLDLSPDSDGDGYGSEGDLTAVAPGGIYGKQPPPSEDLTVNESSPRSLPNVDDEDLAGSGFDDATIKMDRGLEVKKAAPRGVLDALRNAPSIAPRIPAPIPAAGRPHPSAPPAPTAPPAPQPPRSSSPAGGFQASAGQPTLPPPHQFGDDPRYESWSRSESRICGMCQGVNAPHARVCSACGTLLVQDGRMLGRAHVPTHPGMMQMPQRQGRPTAPPPMPYGHGPSLPMPYPQQPMFGQRPPPPPSMWERFLTWTGFRTR